MSQYFGSLLVIFCVELASAVWTYDEVRTLYSINHMCRFNLINEFIFSDHSFLTVSQKTANSI